MFRPARAALRFLRTDPAQIELPLAASPESFRARLDAVGLDSSWHVTITDNRATMVSFRGRAVRVHRAYLSAPDFVIQAIARFVTAARRDVRREASRVILQHAPERAVASDVVSIRSRECTHPADVRFAERLVSAHTEYNRALFSGSLQPVGIRVSRRMRRKLGHYSPAADGMAAEIAIARRHIRADPWDEVLRTLLHEMVHQWQDETGFPLAHDARFRRMARQVGADPAAVRRPSVQPASIAGFGV